MEFNNTCCMIKEILQKSNKKIIADIIKMNMYIVLKNIFIISP